MLRLLLHLIAPDEKLPAGSTPISLSWEGLPWPWALVAFILFSLFLGWSYLRFARILSRSLRLALLALRCFFLALLLLVLLHPVLVLPLEEMTRHPLLVLLDLSQSMGQTEHRDEPPDLVRAAIARGSVDPTGGLNQSLTGVDLAPLRSLSRAQLLESLAANSRLDLWPRLQAAADLEFSGFGQQLRSLGHPSATAGMPFTTAQCASFFQNLAYDDSSTAIGDGLRDLLDQSRGTPVAGILLVTDGGNNAGSSPLEAAATADQDGVPLFIYGVGVKSPPDIVVTELTAPPVANLKEKIDLVVHFHTRGLVGLRTSVQLRIAGKIIQQEPLELRADGEQEVNFSYAPNEAGPLELEAYIPPLPQEALATNNRAVAHVRVLDEKVNVLLVEGAPRWDFQYLLTMLQRDRHIHFRCVLLQGDPGLAAAPDSPFLDQLPSEKNALFANEIVILGDVDPARLGLPRMNLLSEWVRTVGGGLIFLAGREFNPATYAGTPLAPLLPVIPAPAAPASYPADVKLTLTPEGKISPLLRLSDNPEENAQIWAAFRGVRWVAPVAKIPPQAQVLLLGPGQTSAGEPLPALALQSYGLGQTVYLGFDETYRWRANTGEKYYTQIWGQIIRYLAAPRGPGMTALTQLKSNRSHFVAGDPIRISGRLFQPSFAPLTDPQVPGTLLVTPDAVSGRPPAPAQSLPLDLHPVPDQPGEYRAETVALTPGDYTYRTSRDPAALLKFRVEPSTLELSDTAMNEKLLREMADASGGRFLREEDLHQLPNLIAGRSLTVVSFKRLPLTITPWLLGLLVLTGCAEWFLRRHLSLK